MSQVIYIIGGALLIYGLDHLYLHFHDVPTNEQELDRELQHMPLYMSIVNCYYPCHCRRNRFSRHDNKSCI